MRHRRVTVAGAIDRELDASLNITVRATSADGSTADKVHDRGQRRLTSFDGEHAGDSQRDGQRRRLRTLLWHGGG
jgi:hypothetical protein